MPILTHGAAVHTKFKSDFHHEFHVHLPVYKKEFIYRNVVLDDQSSIVFFLPQNTEADPERSDC